MSPASRRPRHRRLSAASRRYLIGTLPVSATDIASRYNVWAVPGSRLNGNGRRQNCLNFKVVDMRRNNTVVCEGQARDEDEAMKLARHEWLHLQVRAAQEALARTSPQEMAEGKRITDEIVAELVVEELAPNVQKDPS